MSPTGTVRMLVAAIVVVLAIGSIDAGVGGEWDLFVLFAVGFGLSVALLFRVESRRPAIPIRRDLVAWLRDRAALSGEPRHGDGPVDRDLRRTLWSPVRR